MQQMGNMVDIWTYKSIQLCLCLYTVCVVYLWVFRLIPTSLCENEWCVLQTRKCHIQLACCNKLYHIIMQIQQHAEITDFITSAACKKKKCLQS